MKILLKILFWLTYRLIFVFFVCMVSLLFYVIIETKLTHFLAALYLSVSLALLLVSVCMCMCMCVYVYIYMYIYVYVCVYICSLVRVIN